MEKRTWRHGIEILGNSEFYGKNQMENGSPAIFLNLFTVCSSCKWKFVVCPFVDEETKGSNPFANGRNGLNKLNGLVHLCVHQMIKKIDFVFCLLFDLFPSRIIAYFVLMAK
jgi:hypothetical protein